MKGTILVLTSLLFFTSCKNVIEQKKQDIIVKAMTDGEWVVTIFKTDTTDITTDFTGYKFKYYENNTVDAIKNGTVEKTGVWQGDAVSMNISANFPSPAYPLSLINGTWHIIDNSWTYVKATMTVGSEIRTLRLDKQ